MRAAKASCATISVGEADQIRTVHFIHHGRVRSDWTHVLPAQRRSVAVLLCIILFNVEVEKSMGVLDILWPVICTRLRIERRFPNISCGIVSGPFV